ncbi:serine/threonine protein kinase [Bacillus sp. V3B]|uniref:serine/threonine-protein kinase n=1 Tax=Bacillus sp. V3B TaxID=2804915 RepID=UPI00210AB1AD|nr:serine/threonine-protein kinase [Bacillus sp. V3B]MCQ6276733.1 serine/threonine protein kinase [Bacillus sp. V3B]
MMNHSMKNQCKVKPGTIIEGKWHKKHYIILKELGFGANGIVYLAKWHNQQVALKMSDNGMSITSEVNVLKSFAKVQGSALGPSLLDVDDWERKSGQISFYVMEYIQGPEFMTFIEQKGISWMPVLTLQLLTDLERLHRNGWVFGDLKPENLIVTGPPARIRCIDVGGTTIKGRAIKEYTEFYDRGYWGLGSRKADSGYDLFAVAMIMINTVYPKRFNKTTGGIMQLRDHINQNKQLKKFEEVILGALQGHYHSAEEMRNGLLQIISKDRQDTRKVTRQTRSSHSAHRPVKQKKQKKSGRIETFLIFTIVILLYIFYIYGQLI